MNMLVRTSRVVDVFCRRYMGAVGLLAVLASGGIAVPLCTAHPAKEMRYVLGDSMPSALIATPKFRTRAEEIFDAKIPHLLQLQELAPEREQEVKVELHDNNWKETKRGALIIYTSGTTNLPKGVVSTHTSLSAQASSLITAWEMSPSDHLLHVLPLHHVHGIVNATLAPIMSGGAVEYLFPFSPSTVWPRLVAGVAKSDDLTKRDPITLFMAVPTIYNRLISSLPSQPPEIQDSAAAAIKSLRLAISGSAPLPSSIRDDWWDIAGTSSGGGSMLERYGMTEIGMALSNRLDKRVDNAVGWPLPGVEARLVDIETGVVITQPNISGEIQIRGPTVFREYWDNPEATAKEFVDGNWFKTGDVATMDASGCYFIHGRRSVDIIKSAGEKISALEVEREILELPQVKEVAVVAIPDPDWGQRVAAVVVLAEQAKGGWSLEQMRTEMKKRIAGYKVPTILMVVKDIERNQMGKSECNL